MVPFSGVYQMHEHLRDLKQRAVPGAVVEAGCWKGGLGAFMALSGRDTWLFDSFEGFPEFTEQDVDIVASRGFPLHTKTGYLAVSEQNAHDIADKLHVTPHIIKGWFKDTLPKHKKAIGSIALLRLDGDTYSSTKDSLEALYDSVSPGGIVVIDDFNSFQECRQAVYDFFAEKRIAPPIESYPFGRAYFKVPQKKNL